MLILKQKLVYVPLIFSGIFHIPTDTVWDFLQSPLVEVEHAHFQKILFYFDGEFCYFSFRTKL